MTGSSSYSVMIQHCPALGRDGNVESVTATLGTPPNPDRLAEWGWEREARFSVKVMDWPHEELSPAAGHTIHIALGGGRRPGIATQTDITRPICGTGGSPAGHDAFKSVPDLAFIR